VGGKEEPDGPNWRKKRRMSFPFMMNDFERNSKVTREGFEMEFSRECGRDLVGI
jgi:hypothetical protein